MVDLEGSRLRRVKASTGSGDVTLRLSPNASFEVHVDQGSGDMDNRFSDAKPRVKGREVIGYTRGDGRWSPAWRARAPSARWSRSRCPSVYWGMPRRCR